MLPLPVLHVPPDVASAKPIVALTQTEAGPVIPDGAGLTVTEAVALQPEADV